MPVLEALNYQYRCRYGRHSLYFIYRMVKITNRACLIVQISTPTDLQMSFLRYLYILVLVQQSLKLNISGEIV